MLPVESKEESGANPIGTVGSRIRAEPVTSPEGDGPDGFSIRLQAKMPKAATVNANVRNNPFMFRSFSGVSRDPVCGRNSSSESNFGACAAKPGCPVIALASGERPALWAGRYLPTSVQRPDLADSSTASQMRVVSSASRNVGLVDLLPATLARKSAT